MRYGGLLDGYATAQRRRGLREGTIDQRDRFLRLFFRDVDPYVATAGDVEQWLDGRHLAAKSRSTYLTNLGPFFEWMCGEALRPDNPVVKIVRPRLPRMVPRPAATFDLEQALRSVTPRMRCWLLLAAYEGFRCFEIAGLRREDVLDGQEPPLLRVSDGKGGNQRVLPLNPLVLDALRVHGMPQHGHLFTRTNRPRRGEPLTAKMVSEYTNRHLARCLASSTAHQFRHQFGSVCYRETRDLRLVQELMGHADPRSTAGYVAINPSDDAARVVLALGLPT